MSSPKPRSVTPGQLTAYAFYWLLALFFAIQAYLSTDDWWLVWAFWGIISAHIARVAVSSDDLPGRPGKEKGDQQ